jgi:hypothetical protein
MYNDPTGEEPYQPLHMFPPERDKDDLRQHAELTYLLTGKRLRRPPSGIIYGRGMGYGLQPPDEAVPYWYRPNETNEEALGSVIEWMMEQEVDIQSATFDYLDNPSDASLQRILTLVNGVRTKVPSNPTGRGGGHTMAALLLRSLPATMDQLKELGRREHLAERPEAQIRQLIRRYTKENKIYFNEEDQKYYAR